MAADNVGAVGGVVSGSVMLKLDLFTLKKIQLASYSGSNGQDVLNSLRNQFTRLGAIVMPREIISTYEKKCKDDSLERILSQFEILIKE